MVEGARLEIVWARKSLGGSNPFISANLENINGKCFYENCEGGDSLL